MDGNVESKSFGAAEQLVGQLLLDKWKVIERIRHDDGISGSTRSACYKSQSSNGELAFVKAFDFRQEEFAGDTEHLEKMVREFNYEKNALDYCIKNKISRVTRIFGADKVIISGTVVHFLVCEWADKSLREQQPPGDSNISWSDRFLALRDTSSALAQMHQSKMAHQDIKPSNAMCLQTGELKLTDLGSSSCQLLTTPPHDLELLVGQPNYAPYELLYEYTPPTWDNRRIGCDIFLLGNLCFTSLVGVSLSHLVLHGLPNEYKLDSYTGEFAEVLPFLISIHNLLVPEVLNEFLPKEIAGDVIDLISSLCHPDPAKRGHSKNIKQNYNQYGLQRVISQLDILAIKARICDRGKK